MVEIAETIKICRDPKDDKLLELASSGKADFLVTGDNDMLVLNPFRGIEIITPRDFLSSEQSVLANGIAQQKIDVVDFFVGDSSKTSADRYKLTGREWLSDCQMTRYVVRKSSFKGFDKGSESRI